MVPGTMQLVINGNICFFKKVSVTSPRSSCWQGDIPGLWRLIMGDTKILWQTPYALAVVIIAFISDCLSNKYPSQA